MGTSTKAKFCRDPNKRSPEKLHWARMKRLRILTRERRRDLFERVGREEFLRLNGRASVKGELARKLLLRDVDVEE